MAQPLSVRRGPDWWGIALTTVFYAALLTFAVLFAATKLPAIITLIIEVCGTDESRMMDQLVQYLDVILWAIFGALFTLLLWLAPVLVPGFLLARYPHMEGRQALFHSAVLLFWLYLLFAAYPYWDGGFGTPGGAQGASELLRSDLFALAAPVVAGNPVYRVTIVVFALFAAPRTGTPLLFALARTGIVLAMLHFEFEAGGLAAVREALT